MVSTRSKVAGTTAHPPAPSLTKEAKAAAKAAKSAERARAKAAKAAAKAAKAAAKAVAKAAGKTSKSSKKSKKSKSSKKTSKASKKSKRAKAPEPESNDEESQSEHEVEAGHKRRRTSESEGEDLYVQIKHKRIAKNKAVSSSESISVDIKDWEYSEELPAPKGLKTKIETALPQIYIGGGAPQPRWLVAQSKTMPLPPSNVGYKRKLSASSSSTDYGRLVWYLDEGDYQSWGGLEYPQVFELAWRCLDFALQDDEFRDEIHDTLVNGPLSKHASLNEGWEPAIPPQPLSRYFGLSDDVYLWDAAGKPESSGYYYPDHERPTLAVRPSRAAVGPHQHILTTKLLDQISTGPETEPKAPAPSRALGRSKAATASNVGSVVSDETENDQSEGASAPETQAPSPVSSESASSADSSESESQSDSENVPISPSECSHDGLFSADQIEHHYSAKGTTFKQENLGGKRKASESVKGEGDREKRGRLESSDQQEFGTALEFPLEERGEVEMAEAAPRMAEGEAMEEEVSSSDRPMDEVLNLRDEVFETAKEMCLDAQARLTIFPNPVAIRGLRMWAGEDLTAGNGPDLTVLPAWAGNHRPFQPWNEPPAGAAAVRAPPRRNTKPPPKRPEQKPLSDTKFSSF
ncbi:hypothetical protein N7452_005155 [Penicillium brevicompactum]|uniref:Uncharacterized protein n=1 Tax=Penicillium brevicompactum TaxID=5074 RepID=A0A9W9QI76_PENBR|nr:hypothetical protein N7452_005155 [Penicillium brevicompactum]